MYADKINQDFTTFILSLIHDGQEILGDSHNLNGSVSEVKYKDKYQKYIDSQDGKDFKECVDYFNGIRHYSLIFDKNQRIILINNGVKVKCLYDEQGFLKECLIQTPGYSEPNEKTYYEYNVFGLISKESRYNFVEWINDFESDLRTEIKEEGVLSETIEYLYNTENRLIKVVKFNDKKVITWTISNFYNNNGNIIEQICINKKGSFGNYHKFFEYNSENLVVKKEWKYFSRIGYTETMLTMNNYEGYYLVDKTKCFEITTYHHLITAKYNFNSDVTEITMNLKNSSNDKIYDKRHVTVFFRYRYDEYDNWVSKTGSINEVEVTKVEREIKYFGDNY